MLKVKLKEIVLTSSNSERTLFKDIYFELEKNKIYTILGMNGTGKSTLLKAIPKLLNTNNYKVKGSVIIKSTDIYNSSESEVRKIRFENIKFIFQDVVNSFDQLKNFGYYFDKFLKDKEEMEELLNYFFLPNSKDLFRMYPYEVSGGMAQRINIILALLTHPQIMILDEPTSGIDSAISNLLLLKLKEFVKIKENTILLATQDRIFAEKISDELALINQNGLSDFKPTSQFFETNKSFINN